MKLRAWFFLFGLVVVAAIVIAGAVVISRGEPGTIPTIAVLPTDPPTATDEPTATPTLTPTASPTPTASETASPTPTLTPTLTPSETPSHTPSPPPIVTDVAVTTATATLTETPTSTPTETATPTPTPTPTETPLPATPTPPPAQPCIAVVGDSVAAGESVFELPGVGFAVVQTAPFSEVLADQYRAQGGPARDVLNRSVGAVGISGGARPSYFDTPEYAALLRDRCAYTVIIPWVNDLSSGLEATVAAPAHLAALDRMVADLVGANPAGRILILSYFAGAPAPFALTGHAPGFTAENIAVFNQALAQSCAEGSLATVAQVTCVDVNPILANVGSAYVLGQINVQDFNAQRTGVIQGAENLDYYLSVNPAGMLNGDGVHLSILGKTLIAFEVINVINALDLPPAP
jgi:hypothetical protein